MARKAILIGCNYPGTKAEPTGKNVLRRKRMCFLFITVETGEEDDTSYDECIVPSDMNLITDDDFKDLVDELPRGDGILLSRCQTDQTSADAIPAGNSAKAYGGFSNAIQSILEETGGAVTNQELVLKARQKLKIAGFTQQPGLYSWVDMFSS
ncbi:hypothetical protein TanjilG_29765 [Lupinus angustifolius]|uniref:Peptidase C14 caspase domain-containing protein n=1 Tax=Lupinus angustifolius TaxID=3871 RepID=A0A1J7FPI5_LUPAN|nr:hypothetical protein TanjilG_29765 [Lupinus angustifolius]